MRWLERSAALIREGGIGLLLRQAVHKISAPVLDYESITFFVRDLSDGHPVRADVSRYQARWAEPSDIPSLRKGRNDAPTETELARRFSRGDQCVVVPGAGEELAHSRWITTGQVYIPELDRVIITGAGAVYMYDVYTWPGLRGHGISEVARSFVYRALRDKGLEKIYWYVCGNNPVSMRASRRSGQRIGKVRYLRLQGGRPILFGPRTFHQITLHSEEAGPKPTVLGK